MAEERRRRSERMRSEMKEKVESSHEERTTEPETRNGIVAGAPLLNFRSEPKRGNNVIKTIALGDKVTILENTDKNEYYKVRLETGEVGYISTTFCKEV